MRTRLAWDSFAVLTALAVASLVFGTESRHTDAQEDDLFGPIRSVSTQVERTQVDWHEPGGPTVAFSVPPGKSDYDLTGNRIKTGELVDGQFHGSSIEVTRDRDGNVVERVEVNDRGEVANREVMGPYGITEQASYENGKLTARRTWTYDANGHVAAFYNYDADGTVVQSSASFTDASGNSKDEWEYGRNGSFFLHFAETYDPNREIWTFTNFNEDGSVKVKVEAQGHKSVSYWQKNGEDGVFGSNIFLDRVGKTQEAYRCHPDGTCDRITSYFADEKSPYVSRTEMRDGSGELRLSADYEYELDRFGNWTKRTVWVWSPELGERKLFETDFRSLTYWDR
jgi:hypothetical protein